MVLAAVQSPLLAERKQASVLIPRLCSTILQAPASAHHVSALSCQHAHHHGGSSHLTPVLSLQSPNAPV